MLSISKTPKERRKRPNIYSIGTNSNQVRRNTVQFAHQYTDILDSLGYFVFHTQHALHTHHKTVAIIHRGQIIQTISKWDSLAVVHGLRVLIKTAMQITKMRNYILDNFAICNQFQSEHTMCRRVLWAHINHHFGGSHTGYFIQIP